MTISEATKKYANAFYLDLLKGCYKCLGIKEDWIIDNKNNKSGFQLYNFVQVLKKNHIACTKQTIFIWKKFIILYGKLF